MKKTIVLLIIAAFTLQSCATLFAPKKNTLSVTSDPSGADVIVNGYKMGKTPVELSLAANQTYTIEYRKDGFVSIRAGRKVGDIITKAFVLGDLAERLTLNFQAKQNGFIKVAIEEADGKPIGGFSDSDCSILTGDSLEHQVSWNGNADISHLIRKHPIVRLRFKMKNSDLFSMRFLPFY